MQLEPKVDWSHDFKSLLSSPLGVELINSLNEVHDGLVDDAKQAGSPEKAYGLLKEARGVTLALGHLQFRAVTPKVEGSKDIK